MAGKGEETFFQWAVGCMQNYSNTVEIAGKKAGSKTNDRKQRREIEIRVLSVLTNHHCFYHINTFFYTLLFCFLNFLFLTFGGSH